MKSRFAGDFSKLGMFIPEKHINSMLLKADYSHSVRRRICKSCKGIIPPDTEHVACDDPGPKFVFKQNLCVKCALKELKGAILELTHMRDYLKTYAKSKDYQKKLFVAVMTK